MSGRNIDKLYKQKIWKQQQNKYVKMQLNIGHVFIWILNQRIWLLYNALKTNPSTYLLLAVKYFGSNLKEVVKKKKSHLTSD